MLKIYYKGKLRRILLMQRGYAEIGSWHDAKKVKIWPDDSARSNALRVKLPEKGTEAWAYWVHAVDAVRRCGAAEDCCMYIELLGKRYYLVAAPDGSEALQLEGSSIYFAGGASFPTDGVGASVRVVANVPSRVGGFRASAAGQQFVVASGGDIWDEQLAADEVPMDFMNIGRLVLHSSWRVLLPMLPGSVFKMTCTKGQAEQNPRFWYELSALEGGEVFWRHRGYLVGGGRWKYSSGFGMAEGSRSFSSGGARFWWDNVWGKSAYLSGSVGYKIDMYVTSTGSYKRGSVTLVFPRFSRSWDLEVESVNELSL